jgi:ABC-2 type transport system ATP-binding protein
MEPILQLKNICKSYNKKQILKNISFSVFPGDILAYLGRNGSGKTTTFNMISGLTSLDSGKIMFNKKHLTKDINLQFLFDEPVLYKELTIEEHLKFVCEINHYSCDHNEIQELIQVFEMGEYKNIRISDYSLGIKKKTQLMCSLILKPKILLMDEYISGLDPISLAAIREILVEYAKKGNAIILSTHMLDAAERFCNRAVIIDHGRIIAKEENLSLIKDKYNSLEEYFIATTLK